MGNLTVWHAMIILGPLVVVALWAIALTQIAKAQLDSTAKVVWALIVIAVPLIGTLAWWLGGKPSANPSLSDGSRGAGPSS